MILLQAHHISKSFADQPVLQNIQLEVRSGERVGLVGVNGAGKSTLLKILVGEMSFDEGEIIIAKETTIGYLAQNSGLESNLSIWDEMKRVFSDVLQMEDKLRSIEQMLADPAVQSKEEHYQQLLEEYARLSDQFKEKGGYQYEASIRNILHGFRFADKDYTEPVSSLSGGQKTRLALAKLLLQEPDIIILDEPTNYLDLETLSWLEQYLQNYRGGILVVSHDRYFLDALVNVIYEIERHRATKYHGNYTKFLERKEQAYEQKIKQYRKQQKEIARMEDFVQRNIARASTTKRAQSRKKMLEKMERIEQPQHGRQTARFTFDIDRQSGNDVLSVQNLSIGYSSNRPLSSGINIQAYRGDSIAIVGPNGIGKSTLLKTLVGQLHPLGGSIRKGTNVSIAFYEQEQHHLHPHKTILSEVWDDYPHMQEREVRSLLGQFLFSGDDVEKKVQDLSGGEKARLALAKLILQKANVLILDEPTNHLDIYSKEVLEQSLINYPGTILFVSHDRYFLNKLATKVIELGPNGTTLYLGDYDYYVEKKAEAAEIKRLEAVQAQNARQRDDDDELSDKEKYERNKEKQRLERQRQRRKAEVEKRIGQLEEKVTDLEQQLCQPDVYEDYEKAATLQQELGACQEELDQLLEEWAVLEEESE